MSLQDVDVEDVAYQVKDSNRTEQAFPKDQLTSSVNRAFQICKKYTRQGLQYNINRENHKNEQGFKVDWLV